MFNWLHKTEVVKKPKTLGQMGEEFASQYYKKLGYKIVESNFFNKKGLRKGEIDFIARNKNTLVFVEVKTRSTAESRFGSAAESVNFFKQQKLLKAVKMYLLSHKIPVQLRPTIEVCIVQHNPLDLSFKCVNIIANAVEDFS